MRHGKKVAKLGRKTDQKKAMVNNLVTSLFEHERIKTTETRAKEVRRHADHLITFAKRGDLHARRQVLRVIPNKKVTAKLFDDIGPRFSSRNGGYTRIVKMGPRRGDNAPMCFIELVERAASEVTPAAEGGES